MRRMADIFRRGAGLHGNDDDAMSQVSGRSGSSVDSSGVMRRMASTVGYSRVEIMPINSQIGVRGVEWGSWLDDENEKRLMRLRDQIQDEQEAKKQKASPLPASAKAEDGTTLWLPR